MAGNIIRTMNVVIFGAGRRGLRLARHLIEEEKSVTFLDNSPARCALAQSKLDCMAVTGSATDIEKLDECGCENADIAVAVTDSDEVNLVSCGIVTSRYPRVKTIATIRSLTYLSDSTGKPFSLLGIDHIVNPEQEAASRIQDIIVSGLFSDISYFPGAHYIVFTTSVNKDGMFAGKSLIDIKKELPGRYLIAGVSTFSLKRIILVGATRICRYLLMKLPAKMHRHITLVEKDENICREFSDIFPDILILNGAITDENFWDEENIGGSDLFVAMTENDELNVIVSSYAKKQGTKRSICLIKTNNNYIALARAMGIDAAVSTTESTVDAIMKILRGDNVRTLHSIFDGRIEIYEFVIKPGFLHLNKCLKDINFKKAAVIAGVSRGDDNFIPDGNYSFREGDTVLVVSLHEDYDYVQELFGQGDA